MIVIDEYCNLKNVLLKETRKFYENILDSFSCMQDLITFTI